MKNLLRLLLCLTVPLSDAAAADSQTPQTVAPQVVCFGDSITRRGYPAELAALLNVPVVNAGVGGNTTRAGLARMEADVLIHRPEVAVICFGTNDSRLAEPKVLIPVDRYEANLAEMVERCLRLQIQPVLCTPPPINPEPYFQRHAREAFDQAGGLAKVLDTYRSAVLRVAEARALPVVDLNRELAAHPAWLNADGVHPTPDGNQIIARLVAEKVRPLIKSEQPCRRA